MLGARKGDDPSRRQSGRLSAARTENGGWLIEVAELHRVYPPHVSGDGAGDGVRDSTQPLANGVGRISEPGEVASLRERIAEHAETIADLRRVGGASKCGGCSWGL